MVCLNQQTPAEQAHTTKNALELLAFQRFSDDGGAHGDDLKHWFEAESALHSLYRTDCTSAQSGGVCMELLLPGSIARLIVSMSEENVLLLDDRSGVLAIVRMPARVDPSPIQTVFDGDILRLSFSFHR